MRWLLGIIALLIGTGGVAGFWETDKKLSDFFSYENSNEIPSANMREANREIASSLPIAADIQESLIKSPAKKIDEPIAEFSRRLTKKPFGIYITPQTSPVQPDKFEGYHAGIDIEYGDIAQDVPVYAIADGTVIVSKFASGYGGVVVMRHAIEEKPFLVLYGHLDPASIPPPGTRLARGERIGILGEGHSDETDGARKHLHFAILKKDSLDIRGYVETEEELAGWYDPLAFYR